MRSVRRVLFVCSRNRLRSPTAEQVFSDDPDFEVASAGTDIAADEPVSAEGLAWADLIFVMERRHRTLLQRRFPKALKDSRIICLDIPDVHGFMDPTLVRLLRARVTPHLR